MNREELIRMAREAGIGVTKNQDDCSVPVWHLDIKHLERFAALVAAAEREACAKVCEQTTAAWTQYLYNEGVMDCVQAIRARGKE